MSIILQDINFSYHDKKVLDNVTLHVRKKEHIGILGSSGSGKSTLLKILSGLYEVTGGYREVVGETASEKIRKNVALVMQTPGLFPLSIKDNITCGHPISEERLWEAIRAAQLEEWILSLPEGLNTYVGERDSNISGGQAQRIAIARAMAKDAPVILLDEPTSALDDKTTNALMDALDTLTKGKTVIHVTHRKETLQGYDRIYMLEGGRLYDKESVSYIP